MTQREVCKCLSDLEHGQGLTLTTANGDYCAVMYLSFGKGYATEDYAVCFDLEAGMHLESLGNLLNILGINLASNEPSRYYVHQ